MLGHSNTKKWNDIPNIIKKHNFVRKTKNYLKKTPKWPWEITSRFLRQKERRRKAARRVGVFCQNLDITANTLEYYANFKSKFSFNNGSILVGGGEVCGTSNYQNPVNKFAQFLLTEPIKWKTPSPIKLLIEYNLGRNK